MSAKKLTTISLSELFKRVPPNQIKQFKELRDKTLEYHRRSNRYPEKLPTIDWEYYRQNVRDDCVKIVEQFQVKYEELDHNFAKRNQVLDHSKYYTEWEQLNAKVQDEVREFIEDSETRVKFYEEEIKRIKPLKYENMTVEQFVEAREDLAQFIPGPGKELFWPHLPEDQLGYVEPEESDEKEVVKYEDKIKSQELLQDENQPKPKSK